jgi:hypothetical protein
VTARALALLALAACFDPSYTDATRCGPGDACPAGRACVSGQCLPTGSGAPDAATSDAAGGPRLVLEKIAGATGQGEVRGGGLTCGADCPSLGATVDPGSPIALVATPAPGSFFQGWTGACAGIARTCTLTITQDTTVGARFTALAHNLVFATSSRTKGNVGGLAAADTRCNDAARAAGLGGRWVALLGDSGTDARSRLKLAGGAEVRGLIRMDGQPIADTVADLVAHKVWYPVAFTETGEPYDGFVWTGSDDEGNRHGQDCLGWNGTGAGGGGAAGLASGGGTMLNVGVMPCDNEFPIYCAMAERAAPLAAPAPVAGKLIVVTAGGIAGGSGLGGAETLCDIERLPTGRVVHAFLAVRTLSPARLLQPDQLYVRPDGVPVGTGRELAEGKLRSGIWQTFGGAYSATNAVWTGSRDVDVPDIMAQSSCHDWESNGGAGVIALPAAHPRWWWNAGEQRSCALVLPIYCVEG